MNNYHIVYTELLPASIREQYTWCMVRWVIWDGRLKIVGMSVLTRANKATIVKNLRQEDIIVLKLCGTNVEELHFNRIEIDHLLLDLLNE